MSERPPLDEIEERIQFVFRDRTLLERALVHRSWAHDHVPALPDNERLEFLGDAVLGLVVAERLVEDFPDDEGRLTRARAELVRRESLAAVARDLEIGRWLLLGKGELSSGGREKDSILADAFEALLGAVFRDGGLAAARALVHRCFGASLGRDHDSGGLLSPRDPITLLQERLQQDGLGTPKYRLVAREGPAHAPEWTQDVRVGDDVLGSGSGRSKQEARRAAAQAALSSLPPEGAA